MSLLRRRKEAGWQLARKSTKTCKERVIEGKGEKKRAEGKEVWCASASKFWKYTRNKALGREVAKMMCTIRSNLLGCAMDFSRLECILVLVKP